MGQDTSNYLPLGPCIMLWRPQGGVLGQTQRFSHRTPQLSQLTLSETDVAKLFQRLVIHETVIVLVSQGEPAAARLKSLCQHLKASLQRSPATGVILTAVVSEIVDVMNCILGLLEPFVATMAYIEKLFQSKSGPRLLCCQALMQCGYYAGLLKKERETASARLSLGPEVEQLSENLRGTDFAAAEQAARRLPLLLDRLPRGA